MVVTTLEGDIRTIKVELGERSYPIYIAPGLISQGGKLFMMTFPQVQRCVVVTSDIIHRLHGSSLAKSLEEVGVEAETVLVPEGEECKSWGAAED